MSLFDLRNSARARLFASALACVALGAPLTACDAFHGGGAASAGALKAGEEEAMLKVLADAPAHGFAPQRFSVAGIQEDLRSGDGAKRAAAEKKLTELTLAYARAQHGYGIPKGMMDANWGMKPAPFDAEAEFQKARADGKLEDWLAALPPSAPGYEALRKAYLPYLKVWQAGGWASVPQGGTLKMGSRDPRVAQLRARLAAEDSAVTNDPNTPAVFDAAMMQAVQRFQARVGITPSGVVDATTLKALNVPAAARAAQIRANLERWRWVPREQSPNRIEVNSVAGLFDLYLDNQATLHMLSASGKPGDETPIVASKIETVVLNPTWNVPDSIASEELLPKGDAYLQSHNFTQENGRLVQQPGSDNALGVVKFLFDNPYSVYLHDTPAKAAFTRDQRSVSHGCVRLEHAVQLAQTLLSRESGWSADRVNQTLASQQTQTVGLTKPVQVEIFYWTAFVSPEGISFRDDVYGWDAKVLQGVDSPQYATEAPAKPKKKGKKT